MSWSPADFDLLLAYVHGRAGLTFSTSRRSEVEATLLRAAARAGIPTAQRFLQHIDRDADARDELLADLTIGETYFFRDPEQLEVLRATVLPDIVGRRGEADRIRAWSAGCAAGEEPYSIAIVMHELGLAPRAQIVGTDLSRPRLRAAERARYTKWSLRTATDDLKRSYFHEVGREYQLAPLIRSMVEFAHLNLASDGYPSLGTRVWGMDVILCRNVLIYFDRQTVEKVALRLLETLRPDGWLLLGASDPPIGDMVPCEVVVTEAGLAYRRASAATPRPLARPPAAPPPAPPPPPAPARVPVPDPLPAPVSPPPPAATYADRGAAIADAYARRDYERVVALARRARGASEASVEVELFWARALANQGRVAEAGEVAGRALESHPHSAELHYLHGLLLLEAGRADEAVTAARRSLYLDRGLVVAHLLLGRSHARRQDTQAARRAYRNAATLLAKLPPDAALPAADGETAGRLTELVRVQLQLLEARDT